MHALPAPGRSKCFQGPGPEKSRERNCAHHGRVSLREAGHLWGCWHPFDSVPEMRDSLAQTHLPGTGIPAPLAFPGESTAASAPHSAGLPWTWWHILGSKPRSNAGKFSSLGNRHYTAGQTDRRYSGTSRAQRFSLPITSSVFLALHKCPPIISSQTISSWSWGLFPAPLLTPSSPYCIQYSAPVLVISLSLSTPLSHEHEALEDSKTQREGIKADGRGHCKQALWEHVLPWDTCPSWASTAVTGLSLTPRQPTLSWSRARCLHRLSSLRAPTGAGLPRTWFYSPKCLRPEASFGHCNLAQNKDTHPGSYQA